MKIEQRQLLEKARESLHLKPRSPNPLFRTFRILKMLLEFPE